MASTDFGLNDALAVKLWSKDLDVQALQATDIFPLIGDENAIIQEKNESSKGPGDQVTYGLRIQLVGPGFTENELAEGNGESLAIYSDKLTINELGHVVSVKSENTIDQQRVPFNLRLEARDGLKDWWAKRMSLSFFNQICSYTPINNAGTFSGTKYSGLQGATAATTVGNRILRQSSATDDANLTANDTFTLDLIDKAKEQAVSPPLDANGNNTIPKVRPVRVNGEDVYCFYMHPYQITSMRTNTGTGQWTDITKFAYMGGKPMDNPIFNGALGYYNKCVLREAYDITAGVSNAGVAQNGANGTANVRRAVLLGAQAAAIGFGQRDRPSKYRWNEELFDHKRRMEVSAWAIWGMKKIQFGTPAGTVDFGSVVVSTWAAAHT
ncbi:MAG TPA: N4-gp56 family major capsid protein [Candidatus Cybelea sp.]|nr:N4-gp56 family major capsid protein [Candidatus Cybelea sp.]